MGVFEPATASSKRNGHICLTTWSSILCPTQWSQILFLLQSWSAYIYAAWCISNLWIGESCLWIRHFNINRVTSSHKKRLHRGRNGWFVWQALSLLGTAIVCRFQYNVANMAPRLQLRRHMLVKHYELNSSVMISAKAFKECSAPDRKCSECVWTRLHWFVKAVSFFCLEYQVVLTMGHYRTPNKTIYFGPSS